MVLPCDCRVITVSFEVRHVFMFVCTAPRLDGNIFAVGNSASHFLC